MYRRERVSYRSGWRELGWPRITESGLGQAEEKDCPQPVSAAERDALVRAIEETYRGHEAHQRGHFSGGHPDLNAIHIELWERTDGLKMRPKLIRCKAEARRQAAAAVRDYASLEDRTHDASGHVIVSGPGFWFRSTAFPNMRPYFVRGPYNENLVASTGSGFPGGVKPQARGPEQAPPPAAAPPPALVAPAPVIGPTAEPVFQPAALELELARPVVVAPPAAAPPIYLGAAPGILSTLPPQARGVVSALTEGDVFGVPKMYLVYGALGLMVWSFLKRK